MDPSNKKAVLEEVKHEIFKDVVIFVENYLTRGNKFSKFSKAKKEGKSNSDCKDLSVPKKKKNKKKKKSKPIKKSECVDSKPKDSSIVDSDCKELLASRESVTDSKCREQDGRKINSYGQEKKSEKMTHPSAVKCNRIAMDIMPSDPKIHQGINTESLSSYKIVRKDEKLSWRPKSDYFSFHSAKESKSISLPKIDFVFRFERIGKLYSRLQRQSILSNLITRKSFLYEVAKRVPLEPALRKQLEACFENSSC